MTEQRRAGRVARAGSILLWYVLPGLAVLTVIAYVAAAITLGVNPPVVPVEGVSMRPTLQAGDLVFLQGVDPSTLRKGDVIAVQVPKASQAQYHLPGSVVHRIVKITHTASGLTFQTQGDANPGPDVFKIHSGDVVGEMVGHVRGLGYPILFFRSTQGEIFLGAAALIALVYFLIGLFEERHEYVAGTSVGLAAILNQTEELKRLISRDEPVVVPGPESDARANAPPAPSTRPPELPIAQLSDEVRASRELTRETNETMRELVGAIGEYGEHLRSHTAVMQGLAATTSNLERATGELAAAASGPAVETNLLAELRSGSLRRSLRGYSPQSVERVLGEAVAALEEAESERRQLSSRLQGAEQQLEHYRQLEANMAELIQQAVDEALGRPAALQGPAAGAQRATATEPYDRSLRAVMTRAREGWRAVTAQPQARRSTGSEDTRPEP